MAANHKDRLRQSLVLLSSNQILFPTNGENSAF